MQPFVYPYVNLDLLDWESRRTLWSRGQDAGDHDGS